MKREWSKPEMETLEISQTACTGNNGGSNGGHYSGHNPFEPYPGHYGDKKPGKDDWYTGEDMSFSE